MSTSPALPPTALPVASPATAAPLLTHIQIAARMRTLIEGWLGDAFDIDLMLADANEAREILFVCQASNQPELVRLAKQWMELGPVVAARAPVLGTPPQGAWPRATDAAGGPSTASGPHRQAGGQHLPSNPAHPPQPQRQPHPHQHTHTSRTPTVANLPAATRPAPQETAWSQDTSGFGISRPGALGERGGSPAARSWFSRPRWLGGSASNSTHRPTRS